ncbi:MAG TPA: VOC family protein [Dehalococcoidia bacterium]|jgi:catechol 2,3-dioxygenase-like lactoylglutathione lyase family enzyme
MSIETWDHYTLSCSDLDATWRFYQDALGLRVTERTGFPIKAAIVWLGNTQIVHMFQSRPEANEVFARIKPQDDDSKAFPTGRILHVEFWARDLVGMRKQLTGAGVEFAERTLPDKHQLTMEDPDGIHVGLNFPLEEIQA